MNKIVALETNGIEKVKIEHSSDGDYLGISKRDNIFHWFPITVPIAKLMVLALKRYLHE